MTEDRIWENQDVENSNKIISWDLSKIKEEAICFFYEWNKKFGNLIRMDKISMILDIDFPDILKNLVKEGLIEIKLVDEITFVLINESGIDKTYSKMNSGRKYLFKKEILEKITEYENSFLSRHKGKQKKNRKPQKYEDSISGGAISNKAEKNQEKIIGGMKVKELPSLGYGTVREFKKQLGKEKSWRIRKGRQEKFVYLVIKAVIENKSKEAITRYIESLITMQKMGSVATEILYFLVDNYPNPIPESWLKEEIRKNLEDNLTDLSMRGIIEIKGEKA